jgi:serine/threonine-protein kinase HipA
VAGNTTYLAIERFDRNVIDNQVRTHHQEDMAQATSLNWRQTDVKFQEPLRPNDPKRATVRRIAEALGSIPRGDIAVEQWTRQLTFHVAIGNNDAHAKNVGLMHLSTGAELSQVYDALPNFFQEGLVKWDLALAVNGIFDHRRLSVAHIVAEAASWGVIAIGRASDLVLETLVALKEAVAAITPPLGISNGVVDQLEWNVDRLLSLEEIGERKPL